MQLLQRSLTRLYSNEENAYIRKGPMKIISTLCKIQIRTLTKGLHQMKIVALGLRSSVFQTFYIAFLSFREILTRIGEG